MRRIDSDHKDMVRRLAKPPETIELSDHQKDLLHASIGISSEAGELLDAVKKHTIYGKELDRENIIEELGDLEFYMEMLREQISITRDAVLVLNMHKLNRRYSGGKYEDSAAIARKDKEV